MGRLVADAGKRDWDELMAEYGTHLSRLSPLLVQRPRLGQFWKLAQSLCVADATGCTLVLLGCTCLPLLAQSQVKIKGSTE
jgi:hypothetical protein